MLNKIFLPFYIMSGLFLIMGVYLITVYMYVPSEEALEEASVEINLPVVQLDQYLNLSKSRK